MTGPLTRTTRRLPVLSAGWAMTGAAITFTSLYLAAGVLTPLLVVYREQWRFPAELLTVAFAVYALGFLSALLTLGSLSDHVGRRPVLIGALLVQLASIVLFLLAPGIGWAIAARVVQGVATGAASGALTAALVELAPPRWTRLGAVLGSVSVTGGLAVGSLLAGLAVQLTAAANSLVFSVLAVVTVLGIVATALSPETVRRRPGALRSLAPRVAVPAAARAEFAAAAPVVAAIWMLAGLSGGLAPSMVRSVFHLDSGLLNGVAGFIAPATAAVVGLVSARTAPRRAMVLGIHASVVGAVGIITGVLAGSLVVMFLGQAVAGAGFGASFTAALRLVVPLAATHRRAGLVAAVYVVSYTGFGVPIVIAGHLTDRLGEVPTVTGYTASTVLLALVSLLAQRRIEPTARISSADGAGR